MKSTFAILTVLLLAAPNPMLGADEPPTLPSTVPVLLLGAPDLRGDSLGGHHATLAMGRAGKDGPLERGEKITAGALQETVLEQLDTPDGQVLRRTVKVRRPGNDQVLMEGSIDMDRSTLRPLSARTVQGGQVTTVDYDWERFIVRKTPAADGGEFDEFSLDLEMLEVGAHDVWMAALPLRDGFSARLPALFAATGTKYWAVPRVVGSEMVDIGTGRPLDTWVVELDWWGMGAANTVENFSPGGGANDTGGSGGKYWVLKTPLAGVPTVVRVRTEIDAQTDSVIQLQDAS